MVMRIALGSAKRTSVLVVTAVRLGRDGETGCDALDSAFDAAGDCGVAGVDSSLAGCDSGGVVGVDGSDAGVSMMGSVGMVGVGMVGVGMVGVRGVSLTAGTSSEARITASGSTGSAGVVSVWDCLIAGVSVVSAVSDSVDLDGVDAVFVESVSEAGLAAFGLCAVTLADDAASVEVSFGSVSAHAAPGVTATARPTPNATANAPTRPMYFA
ncbi:hypothetical protein ACFQWH_06200 [Mycolicibacterium sp. GCM10028919]|uniref:hypothetical protein n=1 Tax=Mycolicibacterium sp. GCM10028919 TaxID=3273401 RepID=UPI00360E5BFE